MASEYSNITHVQTRALSLPVLTASKQLATDRFQAACYSPLPSSFLRTASKRLAFCLAIRVPASPPDVRQGSALPEVLSKKFGLCPPFGLWPQNTGKARTKGAAQTNSLELTGGAQPRLTSGGEAGTCNDKKLCPKLQPFDLRRIGGSVPPRGSGWICRNQKTNRDITHVQTRSLSLPVLTASKQLATDRFQAACTLFGDPRSGFAPWCEAGLRPGG